jgi:hypothetical protein
MPGQQASRPIRARSHCLRIPVSFSSTALSGTLSPSSADGERAGRGVRELDAHGRPDPHPPPQTSAASPLSGRGAELAGSAPTAGRSRPSPFPEPSPRRPRTGRGLGEGSATRRSREGGPSPAAAAVGGSPHSGRGAELAGSAPPLLPRHSPGEARICLPRDCEIPDGELAPA